MYFNSCIFFFTSRKILIVLLNKRYCRFGFTKRGKSYSCTDLLHRQQRPFDFTTISQRHCFLPIINDTVSCRPVDVAASCSATTINVVVSYPSIDLIVFYPTFNVIVFNPTINVIVFNPSINVIVSNPSINVSISCPQDNVTDSCPLLKDKRINIYNC